ncbi:hypothetical protein ACOME3_001213 [Neoechinorhynchus agilis]
MSTSRIIELSEVEKHNHPSDVWVVIHGKVYDVTRFLSDHPGGEDVLLSVAGSDATDAFEDVSHSMEAREQLKDYEIGTVATSSSNEADSSMHQTPDSSFNKYFFIGSFALALLSVLVYRIIFSCP